MEQLPQDENPQESQSASLTRRDALKALAAATGALVLSNLPVKWKTPMIEVGALPAHAQSLSGPAPVVSQLSGTWFSLVNAPANAQSPLLLPCRVMLTFNYQDALGQVSGSSMVNGTFGNSSIVNSSVQMFSGPLSIGNWSGGGFSGTAHFPFNSSICTNNPMPVSVQLTVNGRMSNVTNGTVTPPV